MNCCEFLNRRGQQLPRDGGLRCALHKNRRTTKPCTFYAKCQGLSQGEVGLCQKCHKRMYRTRCREKEEARRALAEAEAAAELEGNIAELLNTIAAELAEGSQADRRHPSLARP